MIEVSPLQRPWHLVTTGYTSNIRYTTAPTIVATSHEIDLSGFIEKVTSLLSHLLLFASVRHHLPYHCFGLSDCFYFSAYHFYTYDTTAAQSVIVEGISYPICSARALRPIEYRPAWLEHCLRGVGCDKVVGVVSHVHALSMSTKLKIPILQPN